MVIGMASAPAATAIAKYAGINFNWEIDWCAGKAQGKKYDNKNANNKRKAFIRSKNKSQPNIHHHYQLMSYKYLFSFFSILQ